jgi:hypothetical protein
MTFASFTPNSGTPIVKVTARIGQDFTNTGISWSHAPIDTHGMWTPSDPKKVWIKVDGIYELNFTLFQNGSVTSYDPFITRNILGTPGNDPERMLAYTYVPRISSAAYSNIHACTLHPLKAGDYVAVCSQRTMGTSTSNDPAYNCLSYFVVKWIDRL